MKCVNKDENDNIFIDCEGYHTFCKKCLGNYFRKTFINLKNILLDKYICPICKETSAVQNSIITLNIVFGEEFMKKLNK